MLHLTAAAMVAAVMMTMIMMVIPVLINNDDDYWSQNYYDDKCDDDGNDTNIDDQWWWPCWEWWWWWLLIMMDSWWIHQKNWPNYQVSEIEFELVQSRTITLTAGCNYLCSNAQIEEAPRIWMNTLTQWAASWLTVIRNWRTPIIIPASTHGNQSPIAHPLTDCKH